MYHKNFIIIHTIFTIIASFKAVLCRGYLSGARCGLAYGPADATTTTVSCFSIIQIGFTFLVPAHPGSPGPLNVCVSCVSFSCGTFVPGSKSSYEWKGHVLFHSTVLVLCLLSCLRKDGRKTCFAFHRLSLSFTIFRPFADLFHWLLCLFLIEWTSNSHCRWMFTDNSYCQWTFLIQLAVASLSRECDTMVTFRRDFEFFRQKMALTLDGSRINDP